MKKYLRYLSFLAIILIFKIGNANAQVVQTTYNEVTTYPYDTTQAFNYIIEGHTFNYITSGQYEGIITIDGNIQVISTTDQAYFGWIVFKNETTGRIEFWGSGPFSGTTGSKVYITNVDYSGNGCQLEINSNYIGKGTCSTFNPADINGYYMYYYYYDTTSNTWGGGQTQTYFDTIAQNSNIKIYGANADMGTYQNTWPSPTPSNLVYYKFGATMEEWWNKYDTTFSGEVKSIDLYYLLPTNVSETLEIEISSSTNYNTNKFTPTNYKIYGRKCNAPDYKTCWYEEVNNTSGVTNEQYNYDTNKIKIKFDLNLVDTNNEYQDMKLSIIVNPTNFNIKIKSNKENTTGILDLNTIAPNYSIIYDQVLNEVEVLYINSKQNNINFRFYTKRSIEYGPITFYKYRKADNVVEESIGSNTFNVGTFHTDNYIMGSYSTNGNFYLQTGMIELGPNKPNALYIAQEIYEQNLVQSNWLYINDEVYYTTTNDFTLTINYGGTSETINYEVTNEYLNQAFNNVTRQNWNAIIQIVEDLKEYKNDWLELFHSIYNPLPLLIRNLLEIIYFTALCYGIFLIFKD